MPSAKASVPHNPKRQRSEAEPKTDFSRQPATKRYKLEDHQPYRTPSSFWDNLSRQWLTRRALREFNRRTVWPTTLVPPYRTGKGNIDIRKLKRFARHGGPALSDIRGYPDPETSAPTMDLSQSGSRKRAKTGRESGISSLPRRTSAYDYGFKQHLIDHGVYPHKYYDGSDVSDNSGGSIYPDNWEEINKRLAQPRPSLSPSRFTRKEFRAFQMANDEAMTESKVMSKVFPTITGTADIPSQENLYFGNLKDLTDGSITKAKPDFYDGARPTELNRQVREQLSEYIEPSTKKNAPLLPNFFTEGKGPDGSASVCKLQAMYDGALGTRGMHKLRSYVDPETAYNNKAYTITSTYHSDTGTLTTYTTHPVESTNSNHQTEYRTTQLNSYAMTGNPETFRQGAAALRNSRDWTRDQRVELISTANEKALNTESLGFNPSIQSFVSLSTNEPIQPESERSADELALDNNILASSNHRMTAGIDQRNPQPKISSNGHLEKDKGSQIKRKPGMGS